jgi:hypothetical protein
VAEAILMDSFQTLSELIEQLKSNRLWNGSRFSNVIEESLCLGEFKGNIQPGLWNLCFCGDVSGFSKADHLENMQMIYQSH